MKWENKAIQRLIKLRACQPAIRYVRTQPSFKAAWFNCPDDSWMYWLISELHRGGLITDELHSRAYSLYLYGSLAKPDDEEVVWDTMDEMRDGIPYETIRKAMARIEL